MTFEEQTSELGLPAARIDHVATWLELNLGVGLTAFSCAISPVAVARFAHGDDHPSDATERRLRSLYAVAWFLSVKDGPGSAYDWLVEPNPELENHPPAELLREGGTPASIWFAAVPVF
jgi:hypothetical protein